MQPADADALKYYRVAKQRFEEAALVLDKVELYRAAIYLGGYAIECMLKALLLTQTPVGKRPETVKALKRDYGHSLQLLSEGLRSRMRLPKDVAREITLASSWSPELRYEPGPGEVREARAFLTAVEKVLIWADGRI